VTLQRKTDGTEAVLCNATYAEWNTPLRCTELGPSSVYTRSGKANPALEIHFCPTCGCVLCWRGLRLEKDGRRRVAVNIRLAPPEAVAHLRIDHFDGLDTFDDLPSDGRCVRDLWF
jgi:hypothetical protein